MLNRCRCAILTIIILILLFLLLIFSSSFSLAIPFICHTLSFSVFHSFDINTIIPKPLFVAGFLHTNIQIDIVILIVLRSKQKHIMFKHNNMLICYKLYFFSVVVTFLVMVWFRVAFSFVFDCIFQWNQMNVVVVVLFQIKPQAKVLPNSFFFQFLFNKNFINYCLDLWIFTFEERK